MINVVSPSSVYRGRSYGEWCAKWWQWAYSISKDNNPVLDRDGKYSHKGQSGPVWFLAGTHGDPKEVQRNCAMPAGRAVFIPVLNCCFNNQELGEHKTELDLLDEARADIDTAVVLEASVDGEDMRNLHDYRVESPLFSVDVPSNPSRPKLKKGKTTGVSDGYWILLEPLAVGPHRIHIHSKTPEFETKVDYNLHVSANFKEKT